MITETCLKNFYTLGMKLKLELIENTASQIEGRGFLSPIMFWKDPKRTC